MLVSVIGEVSYGHGFQGGVDLDSRIARVPGTVGEEEIKRSTNTVLD